MKITLETSRGEAVARGLSRRLLDAPARIMRPERRGPRRAGRPL